MTETYVSYSPGNSTLLARDGRYLLVRTAPADESIGRLWTVLESAGDLDVVLLALTATLPDTDFCLIGVTEDGVQLAQSGIVAVLDGRPLGFDRTPGPVPVPSAGGMILVPASSGAGGLQLPIESGVVSAGALVVVQVGAAAAPVPEPEPEPVPGPEPEAEPDIERDFASLLASLPPPTGAPIKPSEPVLIGVGVPEEPTVVPQSAAVNTHLWADVPEFDHEAAEPEPVELPAPIQAPAPQPIRSEPAPADEAGSGDTVLAGICLNGHVSPALAPNCRVCGAPMPPQTPRTIHRPTLGVLMLQDGTKVDLDRGAILGRAPRVPDDATERPHLINLAAYGREVSRQHAEVIVHGWSVFVRDLGSANGTRIHDQFGLVTVLQPRETVLLPPDSVIDIAEVTTIQYRTA